MVVACSDDDGASGSGNEGGSGGSVATGGNGGTGGSGGAVEPVIVVIDNVGDVSMEGHTPRGFQGQGNGLFAGDNLNPNFPDGDGVQIFLSFPLQELPAGTVQSATLRSIHGSVSGTPYMDLGALNAEEVRYDAFSSALWDLAPVQGGATCVFGSAAAGPFECDIAPAVVSARSDSHPFAQVRLRFDTAGDNDGAQDLAQFFITDSNTNEPGIFELEVAVLPE